MKQFETPESPMRDDSIAVRMADTSSGEAARRSQILQRLIKTRAMLQETRNRSEELQCALERFKFQQKKIANG